MTRKKILHRFNLKVILAKILNPQLLKSTNAELTSREMCVHQTVVIYK